MKGRGTVAAPDGTSWRVTRRWIEQRPPRLRDALGDRERGRLFWDGANVADMIGSVWGAGGLIVLAAAALVIVLPILGLAIELVLLLVILLFGLVARFCFGRPWIVEAARTGAGRGDEERSRVVRRVKGWRASGEEIDRMRQAISATGRPD